MWITLFIIVAAVLGLLYLYGVFRPVTTYADKWLAPHLIYYTWRGKSHEISGEFGQIAKDLQEGKFKLATCFGIYYTEPREEVWDCVLGFEVNRGEAAKVEAFLEGHEQYKEIKLKNTRYIGTTLPYINFLSFLINSPKINEFRRIIKNDNVEPSRGLIERYHFLPTLGKTIEIVNPIDNEDQWNLQ